MVQTILRTSLLLAALVAPSVAGAQDTDAPAAPITAAVVPVDVYLRQLDVRRRVLKLRIRAAKDAGDEEKVLVAKAEFLDAHEEYLRERGRLTTRDPGLSAAGGTLVALGGASIVTSAVLGLFVLFSRTPVPAGSLGGGGDGASEYDVPALATLVGGIVGLGVGVPMFTVGLKRQPRDAVGETFVPRKADAAQGVTLTWSF